MVAPCHPPGICGSRGETSLSRMAILFLIHMASALRSHNRRRANRRGSSRRLRRGRQCGLVEIRAMRRCLALAHPRASRGKRRPRVEQQLRFPGQEVAMTWEGTEERYNIFRRYRSGWGRLYTGGSDRTRRRNESLRVRRRQPDQTHRSEFKHAPIGGIATRRRNKSKKRNSGVVPGSLFGMPMMT